MCSVSKDGECINIGEGSITVDYLKNSELDTSVNFPDKYWFYFSDFQGEADVHIKDEIKLQSQFINPFAESLLKRIIFAIITPHKLVSRICGHNSSRIRVVKCNIFSLFLIISNWK